MPPGPKKARRRPYPPRAHSHRRRTQPRLPLSSLAGAPKSPPRPVPCSSPRSSAPKSPKRSTRETQDGASPSGRPARRPPLPLLTSKDEARFFFDSSAFQEDVFFVAFPRPSAVEWAIVLDVAHPNPLVPFLVLLDARARANHDP